jgi:hypothetical protein
MQTSLSDIAAVEIASLQGQGIILTPAEIVELNAIGWEIETPETKRELSRGTPVEAGGSILYPLTLAGWAWFERVGDKCMDQDAALAYAMAHGSDKEIDTATASDVKAWKRGLRCREAELRFAVQQVIASEKGLELPPNKAKSVSVPELSAMAMAECGCTPEVWERHVRIGYISEVFAAVSRSSGNSNGAPSASDPRVQGMAAMLFAVEKIKKSRLTEAVNG